MAKKPSQNQSEETERDASTDEAPDGAPAEAEKEAPPRAVVMQPEDVLRIRVLMPDGREVEHLARAEWNGTVRIHEAPPPAPLVQDPDPISDPSMKVQK